VSSKARASSVRNFTDPETPWRSRLRRDLARQEDDRSDVPAARVECRACRGRRSVRPEVEFYSRSVRLQAFSGSPPTLTLFPLDGIMPPCPRVSHQAIRTTTAPCRQDRAMLEEAGAGVMWAQKLCGGARGLPSRFGMEWRMRHVFLPVITAASLQRRVGASGESGVCDRALNIPCDGGDRGAPWQMWRTARGEDGRRRRIAAQSRWRRRFLSKARQGWRRRAGAGADHCGDDERKTVHPGLPIASRSVCGSGSAGR